MLLVNYSYPKIYQLFYLAQELKENIKKQSKRKYTVSKKNSHFMGKKYIEEDIPHQSNESNIFSKSSKIPETCVSMAAQSWNKPIHFDGEYILPDRLGDIPNAEKICESGVEKTLSINPCNDDEKQDLVVQMTPLVPNIQNYVICNQPPKDVASSLLIHDTEYKDCRELDCSEIDEDNQENFVCNPREVQNNLPDKSNVGFSKVVSQNEEYRISEFSLNDNSDIIEYHYHYGQSPQPNITYTTDFSENLSVVNYNENVKTSPQNLEASYDTSGQGNAMEICSDNMSQIFEVHPNHSAEVPSATNEEMLYQLQVLKNNSIGSNKQYSSIDANQEVILSMADDTGDARESCSKVNSEEEVIVLVLPK